MNMNYVFEWFNRLCSNNLQKKRYIIFTIFNFKVINSSFFIVQMCRGFFLVFAHLLSSHLFIFIYLFPDNNGLSISYQHQFQCQTLLSSISLPIFLIFFLLSSLPSFFILFFFFSYFIRSTINEQVEQRTAEYKKKNEKKLKNLQNQMRHSYTFGSSSSNNQYNDINQTILYGINNKNVNDTNNDNKKKSIINDNENDNEIENILNDISMQFAIRNQEEKSNVEKILLESEHLISKAKDEARLESGYIETMKELQRRLLEASGIFLWCF